MALPTAAGVSGTLQLGAFSSASNVCLKITLATGADATLVPGVAPGAAARRPADAGPPASPAPLVSVALTNTFTGNVTEFALTLQLPPGTVPRGSYPCRVASTLDLGDGSVYVTYTNFTVTVSDTGQAVITGPSGARALSVLGIDTTGVVSIYPPGTMLPSPSPVDTPTAIPTATGTATPVPSPTPNSMQTIAPTPMPTPVKPTPTPSGALAVSIDPDTCINAGYDGDSITYKATVNMPPPSGSSWAFAWSALATMPAFCVEVPPPTSPVGNNGTLGTSDTATIVAPSFSRTIGETGESGAAVVTLYSFSGYDSNGNPTGVAVTNSSGKLIRAGNPIEAGSVTCASQGLSLRKM